MLVKTLIEELQKCNPDDIVVLLSDEEGNGYGELDGISVEYAFENGEIGIRRGDSDSETDEDDLASEDAKPCVVLWPG